MVVGAVVPTAGNAGRSCSPIPAAARAAHTRQDPPTATGQAMTEPQQRIAIVGGNFAGLTAAIKLSPRHAVTVVDPSRHFEWTPNIHEILSSVKVPQRLRLDRAAIVRQAGHRFLRDRVTAVAHRGRPHAGFRRLHRGRGCAVEYAPGAGGRPPRLAAAQRGRRGGHRASAAGVAAAGKTVAPGDRRRWRHGHRGAGRGAAPPPPRRETVGGIGKRR